MKDEYSFLRKLFVVVMASVSFCVQAKIIERQSMMDILPYLDGSQGTVLVVLDIDGVVMAPLQMLGSDSWAYYEGDKFISKCYGNVKEGLKDFYSTWVEVQENIEMRVIDENLFVFLEELKKRGISVLGFTARGISLVDRTNCQLESIGANLKSNCYHNEPLISEQFHFDNGVLFLDIGGDKGQRLISFFDMIGKRPDKIVLLDDRIKNIKSLERMCFKEKISFLGIRYGGADEMITNFVPIVSDIQLYCLRAFNRILTDDEAKNMLNFFTRVIREGGDFVRNYA